MRLFIAIDMSDEIKKRLAELIEVFRKIDADVRWVKPEGMHITLKFLGEIDGNIKDNIVDILKRTASERYPFTIKFHGVGVFPDFRRPRVIWLGIEKGRDELKDIAKELDVGLSTLGLPREEREYEPHLTIGRVKTGRGRKELIETINAYDRLNLPGLYVTRISLIESILKREGPEYKTVESCNLLK